MSTNRMELPLEAVLYGNNLVLPLKMGKLLNKIKKKKYNALQACSKIIKYSGNTSNLRFHLTTVFV